MAGNEQRFPGVDDGDSSGIPLNLVKLMPQVLLFLLMNTEKRSSKLTLLSLFLYPRRAVQHP
jgi:hypothetical protein